MNWDELTIVDPFVLTTNIYVIIFAPYMANDTKIVKALQFGLYLHTTVYKNEKHFGYVGKKRCKSYLINKYVN